MRAGTTRAAVVGMCVVALVLLGGCGGGEGAGSTSDTALAWHRFSGLARAQYDPGPFNRGSIYVSVSASAPTGPMIGAVVDGADQGTSVIIGPEDDPDFAALATLLTNGVDDGVMFLARNSPYPDVSESFPESGAWEPFRTGVGDPDMAGYELTAIEILVTTVSFSQPGPAGITQRFDVTFILHGRAL
jgi:hypothetical protein